MAIVLHDPARRPVRQGEVMARDDAVTHAAHARRDARCAQRIAFVVHGRCCSRAPFVGLPGVPDEGAVLRAVRLRLQPAARLRRPAVVRPRDVPRHRRLRRRRTRRRSGACTPELGDPRRHARSRRCSACVVGLLAIRRQGIYFAMITLALAQMIYFFCLQAPFTGGEDGIQARAARQAVRLHRPLADDLTMYYVVLAIFVAGFLLIYRIDPFAVRPGAEGDPRERAARDLARLRRRPLQAARLRAVGRARRPRRRDQGDRVPASPR